MHAQQKLRSMMPTASVFDSCVLNNPSQILLLSRRRPNSHPFLLLSHRRRKRAAKKGLCVLSSDASSSSNGGGLERTKECSSSFEQRVALSLFLGETSRGFSFVEKRQFFFSLSLLDLIKHTSRFRARAFEGDDVSQSAASIS